MSYFHGVATRYEWHGDTAGIGEAMPPAQPTSITATNATSKERNPRQPLHMDNVKDKRKQSDADPGEKPRVAADIVRRYNCSQPQNQEDDEQDREQRDSYRRQCSNARTETSHRTEQTKNRTVNNKLFAARRTGSCGKGLDCPARIVG